MRDLNQATEHNPAHLLDWRVWADINYLDSATEYREYLPNAAVQNPALLADFTLLSTSQVPSKGRVRKVKVIAWLVVALMLGYSLYALMELLERV